MQVLFIFSPIFFITLCILSENFGFSPHIDVIILTKIKKNSIFDICHILEGGLLWYLLLLCFCGVHSAIPMGRLQNTIPMGRLCFIEIGTFVFFVKKPLHWVRKIFLLGSSYRGWKLLSIQWLIVQLLLLVESDGGSREVAYWHLEHYVLGEEGVEAVFHLRTSERENLFYRRVLLPLTWNI